MLFFSSAPSSSSVSEYIEFVPTFQPVDQSILFFVAKAPALPYSRYPKEMCISSSNNPVSKNGRHFLLSQSNISFHIFCCYLCFFSSCIRSFCDSFDLSSSTIGHCNCFRLRSGIPDPSYLPTCFPRTTPTPRPKQGGLLHSCSSKRVTCVFIRPLNLISLPITHRNLLAYSPVPHFPSFRGFGVIICVMFYVAGT